MRPSVQGLLWDESDGLSEDKLKILFLCWVNDLMKRLRFYFFCYWTPI